MHKGLFCFVFFSFSGPQEALFSVKRYFCTVAPMTELPAPLSYFQNAQMSEDNHLSSTVRSQVLCQPFSLCNYLCQTGFSDHALSPPKEAEEVKCFLSFTNSHIFWTPPEGKHVQFGAGDPRLCETWVVFSSSLAQTSPPPLKPLQLPQLFVILPVLLLLFYRLSTFPLLLFFQHLA